ncbi:MAG: SpoIIE family protein phosphatase, partial [Bacteroidales bacterium]
TYSLDLWRNPATGKDMLLAATRGDVFVIDENFYASSITARIENKTHNALEVYTSDYYPGRIYLGVSGGLEILEFVNGKWKNIDYNDKYGNEISSIVEDENGNLWVASRLTGYARVEFDNYDADFYTYNTEHGLPDNLNWLKLFNYNNKILFLTSEGVFSFDNNTETFKLDEAFCKEENPTGYFAFDTDNEGNIWMSRYIGQQETWIEKAVRKNDGTFNFISKPFNIIPSLWCDAVLSDNSITWLGISNQLYSYNSNVEKNYKQSFNTLIRRVSTLGDSLLFSGTFYNTDDRGNLIVSLSQPDELKPVLNYSYNNLEVNFSAVYFEGEEDVLYSYKLEGFDEWSRWSGETKAVYSYIPVGSYTFKVKARNVYGEEGSPASFSLVVLPPWYRTIWAYIAYGILAILAVYIIIILNTRRLKREKEILEGIVRERTAEVVKQKEEIEKQNENIRNSIKYAKRIQTAALPPDDFIDRLIPERFILFMPRDIVSGDFYWIGRMRDKVVAVAADCTGHGVPGGFMSMLGISYLNQIVSSNNEYSASQILDNLREQVMKSLRQEDEDSESRDGMDISLVIFHQDKNIIEFAGANNPLYVIRNGEIIEVPCDKMPIGIHRRADRNFTNHMVEVEKDDMLFMFSDGYKDQFGGPDGKKFMSKNFKQILIDVHQKPVKEQEEILKKTIIDWTGSYDRIDDIIVMGIRVQ